MRKYLYVVTIVRAVPYDSKFVVSCEYFDEYDMALTFAIQNSSTIYEIDFVSKASYSIHRIDITDSEYVLKNSKAMEDD